jgi:signal transduction histidine kinase
LSLGAIEVGGATVPTEIVRLDEIAADVVESLLPIAQEQGRRLTLSRASAVAVPGIPHLLRRLLLNLVDNALRHTPSTSAVDVTVRTDAEAGVLEVRDQGPGIASTEIDRVFERFHRARRSGAGSGLGLALCREIVAAHRGTIDLDSAPDRGTAVVVRLPGGIPQASPAFLPGSEAT